MSENVTALAPRVAPEWTEEQKNLIKRTVAENATDAELAMFLHVAKKAGLDPLQKQIWFVKRKQNVGTRESPKWEERVTIQAGVDGLQARALRMPDCDGIRSAAVYAKDDFVFDMKAGEVTRHAGNPFAERGGIVGAWAIVNRAGKLPFVALVRYGEYADDRSFLWKNKPAVMIEKVARSTALRRAYPEEFGGLYDPAEMGRDAHVEPEQPKAIEAEIVHPEDAPVSEDAKPEPQKPAAPPYMAVWNRLLEHTGETGQRVHKKASGLWEEACRTVFSGKSKPLSEWQEKDAADVEGFLFPPPPPASLDDVPF